MEVSCFCQLLAFPVSVLDPKWYSGCFPAVTANHWTSCDLQVKLTCLVFGLYPSATAFPPPTTPLPHVSSSRLGHCRSTGSWSRAVRPSLQPRVAMAMALRNNMLQTTAEHGEPNLSHAHVKCQPYNLLWENPELRGSSSTLQGSHHNELGRC